VGEENSCIEQESVYKVAKVYNDATSCLGSVLFDHSMVADEAVWNKFIVWTKACQ
jgi:hypothetical protein